MATVAAIPPQQSAAISGGGGDAAKASVSSSSAQLPLFDAILDLPHPGATSNAATLPRRYIPPPAQSLNDDDKAIVKELLSDAYLQRISGFCFPNYNPATASDNSNSDCGNGNNKVTKYDIYTSQFTSKSFMLELQMQGGVRVVGYVLLYHPSHPDVKGRTDVGRRSTRALVVLVRRTSSELSNSVHENNHAMLYENILSTLESEVCWQTSISSKEDAFESTTVQWRTLGGQLTQASLSLPSNGMLSLSGLEFSSRLFNSYDKHAFGYFGASQFTTDMAILPLLRRVGASIVLRLLAAILCERRIILTSTSPRRLTHTIAQAIPALLRCGMLHWHHVRVPLMPPVMMGHLAAPCPYICGVLSQYMTIIKGIDHLGQVLLVDLDSCELHVYGTAQNQAHVAFPDLLRPIAAVDQRYSQQTSMSSTGASSHGSVEGTARAQTAMVGAPSAIYDSIQQQQHATLTEVLASELTELLRYDKTNWAMTVGASGRAADAVVESFSNVTAKAGKGLKRFLAKKASSALGNSSGSSSYAGNARGGNMGGTSSRNMSPQQQRQTSLSGDEMGVDGFLDEDEENIEEQRRVQEVLDRFWQEEFAYNLRAEEDVRIAMTAFFCCLLGEYSTYISRDANNPGGLTFDIAKFLEQRRLRGDYEGTPMHAVLQQFVQTQMLSYFVHERIDSITAQMQAGATANASQNKCMMEATIDQLRQSKLDYSLPTVRRVVRQISNVRQAKTLQNVQLARERALALTSKNGYEMNRNARADLIQLTEACRIVPMVRAATLSVLWYRIADSKGMQSKHALLSLIVLKNLLLNGPLVCIAEISQYAHVIRVLRVYQSLISAVNARDIRIKAREVYELLVDRSKLFIQRRAQAILRRETFLAQQDASNKGAPPKAMASKKPLRREGRLVGRTGIEWKRMKFAQVHALVKPEGAENVAVAIASDLLDFDGPPPTVPAPAQPNSTPAQINSNNYQAELNDIFSFSGPSPATALGSSCDGDFGPPLAGPTSAANPITQNNETVFDMQGMYIAAATTSDSNAGQTFPGAHSSASDLKSLGSTGTGNGSTSRPGSISNTQSVASNWQATSSSVPVAPHSGGVFHIEPNAPTQSSTNQQIPFPAPMQAPVPRKAPNSVPVFGINQPQPHVQQQPQLRGGQQPPAQWHQRAQTHVQVQQQQPPSAPWQQQRRPPQGQIQPQQQFSSHQKYTGHGQVTQQQGPQPQWQQQQHYHRQEMQLLHPQHHQAGQTQCPPNQMQDGQMPMQYASNAGGAQQQLQEQPVKPKQAMQFDPFA
jgi:hypothetical protein